MRIAQIAPPWLAVPPNRYGGTERVVALLADGLAERGHDVTLFASGGSQTRANLVTPLPAPPEPEELGNLFDEAFHATAAYLHAGEFDVIHDHSGLVGASIGALLTDGPPVVHTLHGAWKPPFRRHFRLLDGKLNLVAISASQRASNRGLRYAAVIHHGLDPTDFPFDPAVPRDDVLVFLGRSSPEKGVLQAIEIARRVDLPLVMMIKVGEPDELEYWRDVVRPRLHDGVEVILNAGHETKVAQLARARALVFPMAWCEPFGLVMIEAMAVGTPVVVTRRGSAPEIVVDGETGYLVDPRHPVDASVAAIEHIDAIDPAACRAHFEARFAADRMVDQYESLFRRLVVRAQPPAPSRTKARRFEGRTTLDPKMAASGS
jgi:glycosyltransferase involved in cell wall biosynthesis